MPLTAKQSAFWVHNKGMLSFRLGENVKAWDMFDQIIDELDSNDTSNFVKLLDLSSLTDNSLHIILGAALAIRSQFIYQTAMSKLTDKFPHDFNEASDKKLPLIHQLLEMAFHGAALN